MDANMPHHFRHDNSTSCALQEVVLIRHLPYEVYNRDYRVKFPPWRWKVAGRGANYLKTGEQSINLQTLAGWLVLLTARIE